jgi:hypothetical protein
MATYIIYSMVTMLFHTSLSLFISMLFLNLLFPVHAQFSILEAAFSGCIPVSVLMYSGSILDDDWFSNSASFVCSSLFLIVF